MVRKFNGNGFVVPALAPWVAVFKPVVRLLHLEPVNKSLLEQAEFISQPVAFKRYAQRGRAVQIARGKPAQSAIAERRIVNFLHCGNVRSPFAEECAHFVQYPQVVQV